MSYNRLIHDFLDSELDQTGQEVMFAHLSSNAELRAEFNQQIKLQKFAALDMQNITVPSDLTGTVFSRLGFAVPNSRASLPFVESNGVTSNFSTFIKRYSGLLFLLLFLITTATSLYLLNENYNLKNNLSSSVVSNKNIPLMSSSSENSSDMNSIISNNSNGNSNQFKDENSNSGFSKKSDGSTSNYYVKNNLYNKSISASEKSSGNVASSDENLYSGLTSNYSKIELSDYSAKESNVIISINSLNNSKNSSHTFGELSNGSDKYASDILRSLNLPKWSIQFRRLSAQSEYPPVTVGDEANFFTNNAIGVWYHYTGELSFGIESGAEMFSQEFSFNNSNYSQAPMRQWAGLSIRWNPQELLIPYTLNPYFSQTIAYSSLGTVSRSHAGINFSLTESLSIFGGAEYGLLIYPVNDILYNSGKLGITAGININFR